MTDDNQDTKHHARSALTDARCRSLAKAGRYADGHGLYLLIDSDGGPKRWLLRMMINGRRRDLGLGGYPTVTLAAARETALELRRVRQVGGDVIEAHRKMKAKSTTPTFAMVAEQMHAASSKQWKNPKHREQWIGTLRTYCFPHIGERPVDQIERPDIIRCLSPIWLEKPETARRVRQRLKAVLDWAKAHGHRHGDNPVLNVELGLPKQNDEVEHHAAIPFDAISEFLRKLRESDAGENVKLALELLTLTATRSSETRLATWSEINWDAETWTIPSARMKAGREHTIPLSARCIAILKAARASWPDAGDDDFIFPGHRNGVPMSENAFNDRVQKLGYDATAHGLRSTFRDWAAERSSFPSEVVEMSLAHTIANKVEAAYRRGDLLTKRRALMSAWAGFATTPPKQGETVVRLERSTTA